MTSFLTFSVTAVRISNDIPTQSEYLPLVTLFIMLSMIYTFIGLVFFILIDSFAKMKRIPSFFIWISGLYWIERFNKNLVVGAVDENEENETKKFERTLSILNTFFCIILVIFVSVSSIVIWLLIIQ